MVEGLFDRIDKEILAHNSRLEGEETGLAKGITQGIKQGIAKGKLQILRSYIKKSGASIENAFETLDIPQEERAFLKSELQKTAVM